MKDWLIVFDEAEVSSRILALIAIMSNAKTVEFCSFSSRSAVVLQEFL